MRVVARVLLSDWSHLACSSRLSSSFSALTLAQRSVRQLPTQRRLLDCPSVSISVQAVRGIRVSGVNAEEKTKRKWPFHMTMSDEQKQHKQQKIEAAKLEEKPKGVFATVKFYLKRYWYIAVPAHAVSCLSWLGILYLTVKSGVDIPALLNTLHMPDWIIEKVRNTPPSAGVAVVTIILYKIAMPIRYLCTLGLIQVIFATLRRLGKLKTAREVEYKVRTDYETMKTTLGRRGWNYTGVRSFTQRKRAAAEAAEKEARKKED